MLTAVGKEFARLRQAKGLKQTEVADQLKVPLGNILRMERKTLRPNGETEHAYVPFHRYLAYANLLGVTFTEIFAHALAREETGKKVLPFDVGDEVPQEDKPQAREEDVLAQVYQVIEDLKIENNLSPRELLLILLAFLRWLETLSQSKSASCPNRR